MNRPVESDYTSMTAYTRALEAYCDSLQPEQEPVAYINVEQHKLEWANKYMSWHTPTVVNLPKIPLYTTPPQRPWVGLTEKEVDKIIDAEIGFNSCWGPEEIFARAIEAKLKEKNV